MLNQLHSPWTEHRERIAKMHYDQRPTTQQAPELYVMGMDEKQRPVAKTYDPFPLGVYLRR